MEQTILLDYQFWDFEIVQEMSIIYVALRIVREKAVNWIFRTLHVVGNSVEFCDEKISANTIVLRVEVNWILDRLTKTMEEAWIGR
jgi:hypothetical protein